MEKVTPHPSPFVTQYLKHMLSGDRKACSEVYHHYLVENKSIADLYEEVFKPSLYQVGELWEHNKISVAEEHLATAITERMMNELYDDVLSTTTVPKKIVLTCVEHEQHQVGIKMVADVFEMHGWESFFLGTGIPLPELLRYIEEVDPDVIALSLSIYFNYQHFIDSVKVLKERFPTKPLLVGGQALRYVDKDKLDAIGGIVYLKDLYAIEQFINNY